MWVIEKNEIFCWTYDIIRDGGVGIIAYSNDIRLRGKYLVQCKCFSGMVGDPYIRDLFGVVLS